MCPDDNWGYNTQTCLQLHNRYMTQFNAKHLKKKKKNIFSMRERTKFPFLSVMVSSFITSYSGEFLKQSLSYFTTNYISIAYLKWSSSTPHQQISSQKLTCPGIPWCPHPSRFLNRLLGAGAPILGAGAPIMGKGNRQWSFLNGPAAASAKLPA